jgi:polysaccharide biosynthesis protein VpsJ
MPRDSSAISQRAGDVWEWARRHDFHGADPYDGLNSRVLAPFLDHSRFLRLAVIQAVKRSPIDLRPLLAVPAGCNPKGLALFLSGLTHRPDLPDADLLRTRLVDRMLATASLTDGTPAFGTRNDTPGLAATIAAGEPDESPIGWGYHFPWQARAFLQKAYHPTVVATSFVLDALGDVQSEAYPEMARRSARFVMEQLYRYEDADGICFSYSPTDKTRVYNASLFGAKILARAASHVDDDLATEYRRLALAAGDWVVSRQQSDGSWVYGEADHWQWIDNLHTGFNLETLDAIESLLDPGRWNQAIHSGLSYYRDTMIEADGTARYYSFSRTPLDAHTFAQTAITLLALKHRGDGLAEQANLVLARADVELWDQKRQGYLFQKSRWATSRTIHMRWSQGWMFRALAMASAQEGN